MKATEKTQKYCEERKPRDIQTNKQTKSIQPECFHSHGIPE